MGWNIGGTVGQWVDRVTGQSGNSDDRWLSGIGLGPITGGAHLINPNDPLGELGRQGEIAARGINETLGLSGQPDRGPQPAKEDPRITAIRDRLSGEAKSFRSGLPRYKEEKYGMAAGAGRDQLEGTVDTIRKSANQRGLLYSGMREGQEAGARSRMASILAAQRAEINREAEELASAKDASAASVGLSGYDAAIKRADDTYNQQLANEIARRKALAQIGEGVGYGFGAYFGKKAKPKEE